MHFLCPHGATGCNHRSVSEEKLLHSFATLCNNCGMGVAFDTRSLVLCWQPGTGDCRIMKGLGTAGLWRDWGPQDNGGCFPTCRGQQEAPVQEGSCSRWRGKRAILLCL